MGIAVRVDSLVLQLVRDLANEVSHNRRNAISSEDVVRRVRRSV